MARMEHDFINWLRQRSTSSESLLVGPGDDAAVLSLPSGNCVVTVDTLMEGVHFEFSSCSPQQVGRKALAVNLSDLAAMAAKPVAAVLSLSLSRDSAGRISREIFQGFADMANQFGVAIAGGDTNTWEGALVVSVTAIGVVEGQGLGRDGARPGDWVVVTGALGGSILGKHYDFLPRVEIAQRLADNYVVHAATDISDGLSMDLHHVCTESGCGAELELGLVPIADAARQLASSSGRTPLSHALSDGEDFELLLAIPPDQWKTIGEDPVSEQLTRIGRFVDGSGLFQISPTGTKEPLQPRGFQH